MQITSQATTIPKTLDILSNSETPQLQRLDLQPITCPVTGISFANEVIKCTYRQLPLFVVIITASNIASKETSNYLHGKTLCQIGEEFLHPITKLPIEKIRLLWSAHQSTLITHLDEVVVGTTSNTSGKLELWRGLIQATSEDNLEKRIMSQLELLQHCLKVTSSQEQSLPSLFTPSFWCESLVDFFSNNPCPYLANHHQLTARTEQLLSFCKTHALKFATPIATIHLCLKTKHTPHEVNLKMLDAFIKASKKAPISQALKIYYQFSRQEQVVKERKWRTSAVLSLRSMVIQNPKNKFAWALLHMIDPAKTFQFTQKLINENSETSELCKASQTLQGQYLLCNYETSEDLIKARSSLLEALAGYSEETALFTLLGIFECNVQALESETTAADLSITLPPIRISRPSKEAFEYLKSTLRFEPHNPTANYFLGLAYMDGSEFFPPNHQLATEHLEKALIGDPENQETCFRLFLLQNYLASLGTLTSFEKT